MPSQIQSAALIGIDSKIIEVEVDVSYGFPKFIIVGLPDAAVQEAKVRVYSAIRNSGLPFPRTRVAVNLAPADLKKEGPSYDFPIALGILLASKLKEVKISSSLFIGELSLDGMLRKIPGILSIVLMAKENGIKNIFLPEVNAPEASIISDVKIYPVRSLSQLVKHLKGEELISPLARKYSQELEEPVLAEENFSFIRGQEYAKRALAIAACGGHNLFMVGPPGTGKTLLARSIISLLPPLELREILEVTRIYSVAGKLSPLKPLIQKRPFRSPHHSASCAALIGGGRTPRPGEISLAHRGVLFLDELPEFPRAVLESLRQPLEDGTVTVARVFGSLRFPAKFILITAANPCPCGFLSDPKQECRCTPSQVIRYQKRVSGPLLDRMDLQVEVPRLSFSELKQEPATLKDLEKIKERINLARQIQKERFAKKNILENSEMTNIDIKEYCQVDLKGETLLKQAVEQLSLSARAYFRVLKVARTIADLEQEEKIKTCHLAEAIQYRMKV